MLEGLISWIRGKVSEAWVNEYRWVPDTNCEHERWTVYGVNRIGHGSCLVCGQEVCLDILFRGLQKRMEDTLAKFEEKNRR